MIMRKRTKKRVVELNDPLLKDEETGSDEAS